MKPKRKKIGTRSRKALLTDIAQAVDAMGMKLYPTTERYIKISSRRTQVKYPGLNQQDLHHCKVALVAAGIEEARQKGNVVVRIGDIKKGWAGRLSLGPGNCPPFRCAKRSIVDRLDEVQAQMPTYRELTSKLSH